MKEKEDINTQQAILDAAEEEFLINGLASTRTTEIAKKAGVTHAMLHYYYRTKENLFNHVFEKKIKLITTLFANKVEEDLPFNEKIKIIVEEHFNFLASHPHLPFFVLNEFITNKDRLKWFVILASPSIDRIIKKLTTDIDEAVNKGEICPIDPVNLVIDIVSLNVFSFVAHPLIKGLAEQMGKDYKTLLEERKKENITVILKRVQV